MKKTILNAAAVAVAKMPGVFGRFTLGVPNTKFSKWYEVNRAYRFPVGTKLKARDREYFGYGIRVEGVVVGYGINETWGHDMYIVNVTSDSEGDWERWRKVGWVDPNAERVTQIRRHHKWNVENHWLYVEPFWVRMYIGLQKMLVSQPSSPSNGNHHPLTQH